MADRIVSVPVHAPAGARRGDPAMARALAESLEARDFASGSWRDARRRGQDAAAARGFDPAVDAEEAEIMREGRRSALFGQGGVVAISAFVAIVMLLAIAALVDGAA